MARILPLLLMTLLIGCGVPKKADRKQDVTDGPFQPLVDNLVKDDSEKLGELKLSAEASESLVNTLTRVLGGSGELTWNSDASHSIDIGNNGTVTLQPGTKIKYQSSEFGTVFEFSNPRPSVKAPAGPIKVKVALVSVDFHKDNTGTATLDTGVLGIKKRHDFKISFDSDEPRNDAAPERQIVWCYTTEDCGPCQQAKAALSSAGDLGFDVKFTSNSPSWVTSFPTFHWNDKSGKSWKRVGWPGTEQLKRIVLGDSSAMRSPVNQTIWSLSTGDTKPNLIQHLLNDGIHRGKFKKSALDRLSRDELVMLHSKDHNGN